jgi:hypothetical protein
MFSQLRLVAGGFRLNKTSKSENESGSIRAVYVRRGQKIDSSIERFVEN